MKSKMKKLVSLVLAMAMVFTMSLAVYAAEEGEETGSTETTTYTITINNTTAGHTYEAYQIFKGTLSTDGTTLSDIEWGTGVDTAKEVDDTTLIDAIKAISDTSVDPATTPFSECTDAASVAEVLAKYKDDTAVAQAFADVVAKYLSTTKAESTCNYSTEDDPNTTEDESVVSDYTISGLAAGYYLVKDASSLQGEDDAYTDYVLKVVKNENVTPKSSTPEVYKKVEEKDDADSTATTWQDAADYDIDDSINYKLTGTLPDTLSTYSVYYYQFTDTLSAGLTYNEDAKVTLYASQDDANNGSNGTDITNSCAITSSVDSSNELSTPYTGGTVLTVTINDVKSITGVTSDSVIVVTYSATLNNKANTGTDGNPNEVYLTYSNNPNNAGSGETGQTPEDKVTVFTFELDVNKVKSDKTSLTGAGFTLYKYIGIGVTGADEEGYVAVGEEVKGTTMTTFEFKGLDSGKYKIVESTVPDGYNKADDIYFQIVAEYDKTATDPKLTNLVIKDLEENIISSSEGSFSVTETTFEKISTDVVNKSGSILPSTGGIGTTIFYIVGAILVLGAGVILVTRRRTAR